MAIYSLAVRTSVVTTATAGAEIRAITKLRVLEVGVFLAAATASTFGIGRPANTPSGGTVTAFLPHDPGLTASTSGILLTGQTVAPTVPAQFLRRIGLPAVIGSGVIWTFPEPIIVAAGASLVLWNLSAVGVSDFHVMVED